jgi:hypothetical protein
MSTSYCRGVSGGFLVVLALFLLGTGTAQAALTVKLGAGTDTVTIVDNGAYDLDLSFDTIRYEKISPPNSGWVSSATVYHQATSSEDGYTFTIEVTYHAGGPTPVEGFIIYGGSVGPLNCTPIALHGHLDGMFSKCDSLGNAVSPGEPLQKCATSLTGTVNNNPAYGSVFLNVPCEGRLCSPPTSALADFPYNPGDQSAAVTVIPTELYGRLDFTLGPPEGAIHCDRTTKSISAKVWLSCTGGVPSTSLAGIIILVSLILIAGYLLMRRRKAHTAA